jgi:hypothetical protein
LASHQLTDIQGLEQLFNLLSLAAQNPLELLAEMLRLCPRDQKNNAFFNCLFLKKLPSPRELHIMLYTVCKMGLKLRYRADDKDAILYGP